MYANTGTLRANSQGTSARPWLLLFLPCANAQPPCPSSCNVCTGCVPLCVYKETKRPGIQRFADSSPRGTVTDTDRQTDSVTEPDPPAGGRA
jgi:hypothetical protein